MPKLFWYDLETTGVDWWRHQPHQLAAIIEIDGVEKERVNLRMRPDPGTPVSQEALDACNVSIEDLRTYPLSQMEGYQHLCSVLGKYVDKFNKKDKFHLVGFNNRGFDDNFLRALWTRCDDVYFGSWFWSDSIDVMVLASNMLKDVRADLDNFKLGTVAAHLGIEPTGELHDALTDVLLTRDIYKFVTGETGL